MERINLELSNVQDSEYFSSLLQDMYNNKLLSKKEMLQINEGLFIILQDIIYRFTGGDSSVSKERAQSLMDSIIHVITIYIKQMPIDIVIDILKKQSIQKTYQEARKFFKTLLKEIEKEIVILSAQLIDIDILNYIDTLKYGLPQFLNAYNQDYITQDIVLTLDYPTFIPIQNKKGVVMLCEYIRVMKIEHLFYNSISINDIRDMLKHYHKEYQVLVFNLAELLWKQLLLKRFIAPVLSLVLSMDEVEKLYCILKNQSKEDIIDSCMKNMFIICKELKIDKVDVITYFSKGITSIASQIYQALRYDTLNIEIAMKNND